MHPTFQRNINKHIRKANREVFAQELKQVFNPDSQTLTQDLAIEKLKGVLKKWESKYPRFSGMALKI